MVNEQAMMIVLPLAIAVIVLIVLLIVRLLTSQRRAMHAASKLVLDHEHMTDAERMLVLLEGLNRRLLPITLMSTLSLVLTIVGLMLVIALALTGNLEIGGIIETLF